MPDSTIIPKDVYETWRSIQSPNVLVLYRLEDENKGPYMTVMDLDEALHMREGTREGLSNATSIKIFLPILEGG